MVLAHESTLFHEKVVPHVELISHREDLNEEQKLRMIGGVVQVTLEDVENVTCRPKKMHPSVLPEHTDETIDQLAAIQRKLRLAGYPEAIQKLMLERYEHGLLIKLREER